MATKSEDLVLQFVAEQKNLVKNIDDLIKRLDKLEDQTKKTGDEGKKAGSKMEKAFERASNKIGSFAKKMVKYAGIAGFGALTASIYKSVKAAADFETKLAEVSTLLGDKAEPKMRKFEKAIRDMAKTTSASAGELTKGLYQVISAGTKGTEEAAGAMDLLGAANKVAVAGVSDTFSAVDVLTTALNAYGRSTDDATKFSDILFSTVKLGKINFQQLSSSIGMVTSAAAGSGVSFEEVNAAIAAMTALGVPAQRAITAMNGIIRVAAKSNKELDKAMKARMGTTISDILETKGFTAALEALNDVTGGSTIMMQKLGIEQEAIQGLAVLAGSGIGKFKSSLVEMNNAAGATDEAYKKMSNTFEFQTKKFWNVVNDVFISIGKKLIPMLLQKMQDVGKWVENHGDEIKEFVESAFDAIVGLGKFILEHGEKIAKTLATVWAIGKLKTWVSWIGKANTSLLTTIGRLSAIAIAVATIPDDPLAHVREKLESKEKGKKAWELMVENMLAQGGLLEGQLFKTPQEWTQFFMPGYAPPGEKPKGKKKPPSGKGPKLLPEDITGTGAPFGAGFISAGVIDALTRAGTSSGLALVDTLTKKRADLLKFADEFAKRGVDSWYQQIGGAELESVEERRAYAFAEAQKKLQSEPTWWDDIARGFKEALGEKLLGMAETGLGAIAKPFGQIGDLFEMGLAGANVDDVRATTEQMVHFWEMLAENIGPVLDYLIDEGIPMIIDAFVEHIPDIIDTITDRIPDIIAVIIHRIPEIALALAEAVARAIGNLLTFGGGMDLTQKWGDAVPILGHAAGFVADIGKGIGEWIGSWFHEGGFVKAANNMSRSAGMFSNVIKAHSGLFVRPSLAPGDVPAILQAGEGVIRREVVAAMGGEDFVNSLNRGEMRGGDTYNLVFKPQHMFARDSAQVVDEMQAELVRQGTGKMRRLVGGNSVPGWKPRRA